VNTAEPRRCAWAQQAGPLDRQYHDTEWGVPVHEDRTLFEYLILEGAQAGLSWSQVLARREGYRTAFAGFDPAEVARFTDTHCARLLRDPGIIRNRLKVAAAVINARAFLALQEAHGSFDAWLWRFTDGRPLQNTWAHHQHVPASTPLSQGLSKALARAGFRFVGPTIVYAFMQAVGMVNDHTTDCFRHEPVRRLGASPT
jgi:DNA-3-methyladenine glycosylase I